MFHSIANETISFRPGWAEPHEAGYELTSVSQMFEAAKVKHIYGLNYIDTSNCLAFGEMFSSCYYLEDVDIPSFDTRNADETATTPEPFNHFGMLHMFGWQENEFPGSDQFDRVLQKITIGPNFKFKGKAGNVYRADLPIPEARYIPGATGLWYDKDGNTYEHDAIPDPTEVVTYYASPLLIPSPDEDLLTKRSSLDGIADTIRTKGGTTAELSYPEGFKAAIEAISGGGKPEYQGTETFTENGPHEVFPEAGKVFSSFLATVNVSGGTPGITVSDVVCDRQCASRTDVLNWIDSFAQGMICIMYDPQILLPPDQITLANGSLLLAMTTKFPPYSGNKEINATYLGRLDCGTIRSITGGWTCNIDVGHTLKVIEVDVA